VTDDNVMQVVAAKGKHPLRLYKHQDESIQRMVEKMKAEFAGVLVIPTGGGKRMPRRARNGRSNKKSF
jgi:superfamily II DNA or RNA helicase